MEEDSNNNLRDSFCEWMKQYNEKEKAQFNKETPRQEICQVTIKSKSSKNYGKKCGALMPCLRHKAPIKKEKLSSFKAREDDDSDSESVTD